MTCLKRLAQLKARFGAESFMKVGIGTELFSPNVPLNRIGRIGAETMLVCSIRRRSVG